jgi:predicted HD phosphohydrolase
LHHRALRNRTQVAFHDLRIGIKRFRYTIENFLPRLHEAWGTELKELQDALGDVHDLDVLWQTAAGAGALPASPWQRDLRARVQQQREQRLQKYRERAVGGNSLWQFWRAGLPQESELRKLGFERLEIWASFLSPDVPHTRHVASLALQIFDGMEAPAEFPREIAGYILRAAALMHDVGHAQANRGHHKLSARMIRRISPPPGWSADELHMAALIARYHRGALPAETQSSFAALSPSGQRMVQFLGGILRLACACDHEHDKRIRSLRVESSTPVLTMRAEGYEQSSTLAQHVAAERYLLEIACRRPVYVLPAAS